MDGAKGSLTRRVASNAAWSGGARLLAIALNVVTIPLFLRGLGGQQFGIYALIQSLTGLTGLLNLGVGEATIKYMAENLGRGRPDESVRYFRNGLMVQIIVGLLGFLFLAVVAPIFFQKLLQIDPEYRAVASRGLVWFGCAWAMRTINAGLHVVPISHQRYDIAISLREGATMLERLLGIAVVLAGGTLSHIFQVQLLAQSLVTVASAGINLRLMPGLRLLPILDRDALRDTLHMGTWQSIASVTGDLSYTLDRWLVGILISTKTAGYYSAVQTITTSLHGVLGSLASVLFPTFTYLYAREHRERATRIFVSGTWLLTQLGALAFIPLFVFARPVLMFWLGAEVADQMTSVLRVLIVAQLTLGPSLLQNTFLVGVGRTHWNAVLGVLTLVAGFGSNWILLVLLGRAGMGWSRLAASIAWAAGLLKMRRTFFPEIRRSWYFSGLFGGAVSALGCLVFSIPWIGRIESIHVGGLLQLGFLCAASCFVGLVWLAAWDRFLPGCRARREMVRGIVQSVLRARDGLLRGSLGA